MLTVSGLVVIPEESQYKETPYNTGVFLNFLATSESIDKNGNHIYHRWHMNMWVPKDDLALWRERIKPGKVFHLTTGKIASELKEQQKAPFVTIRVNVQDFIPLAKAYWSEDIKKEE